MADEKKKLTSEQLKSDSERGKTKTDEREAEKLSEDELCAVAGGKKDYCNHLGLDDLSSAVKLNMGISRTAAVLNCV